MQRFRATAALLLAVALLGASPGEPRAARAPVLERPARDAAALLPGGSLAQVTPATLCPVLAPAAVAAAPLRSVHAPAAAAAAPLPLASLVGQKLIVRMDGTTPSASLLGRIQRGEIGGVVLFGANITTQANLVGITSALQAAATAGGQPRLLIAVDQEGGSIKRIPWAPPTRSAPQMGADGRTSAARALGTATGAALRGLGINVDFAPVADVPSSTASFMYQERRTFSFSAARTSRLANAFAAGLRGQRVVPTLKHFPGLGRAKRNTDRFVVTLHASRATLDPGLAPYRAAVAAGLPMIMLSNATYEAWDRTNPAGWSAAIVGTLLRKRLGFRGVTVTDSLSGTAAARHVAAWRLAIRAALAGTDMILLTGSESSTRTAYNRLLAAATAGSIPRSTLQASYDRIVTLKGGL